MCLLNRLIGEFDFAVSQTGMLNFTHNVSTVILTVVRIENQR